jgi:hypothetical protein
LKWPVSSISKADVLKMEAGHVKAGRRSTALHAHTDLKQFFRWLKANDHVTDNWMQELPTPAAKGSKDRVYTTAKARSYVTPLSEYVRGMLKGLPHDEPRVFPRFNIWWSKADRPMFQSGAIESALIGYGAPKDFTFHPLRATCGTWLEDEGESEWHVGLVLNNGVGEKLRAREK